MAASLKNHCVYDIEFAIAQALKDVADYDFRVNISNIEYLENPAVPFTIKVEMTVQPVNDQKIPF